MSDEDAFQLVERDKDGEYCSKKFWRDWYADSDSKPARCLISSTGRIVSLPDGEQLGA
jgi:hypothetical protein